MKIIRLASENIKRLSAVEITPDGNLVILGGRNAAGKSSVLDSIEYALGGKGAIPSEPIRRGEDKAQVVVELDDLIVTRRFTSSGSYLEVTNKEGLKFSSPQKILDKLVGSLSFDPLEFSRMEPKRQRETLEALVGLDFSELDQQRNELYTKRRDVNRDLKAAAARLNAAPRHEDAPDEMVSVAGLTVELGRRQRANSRNTAKRTSLLDAEESINVSTGAIKSLEAEIESLKTRIASKRSDRNKAIERHDTLAAEVKSLEDADEQEILNQITGAETINQRVRENEARGSLEGQRDCLQSVSEDLSAQIDDIDREKEVAVTTANMPIEGLGLDEDGVTLNDLPLELTSGAEQLRVSVAIGLALNEELKVLLVRDGSLLDEDSLRMVAEMAAEADGQVWLERVGQGDEVSVVIENGMVKEPVAAEGEAA